MLGQNVIHGDATVNISDINGRPTRGFGSSRGWRYRVWNLRFY